jgi:hypothetical protein
MKKSIIFAAVLVAAAVSCQKETIQQTPDEPVNFTIKATREACTDTRAGVDPTSGAFTWNSGDAIGIWTGESFEKLTTTDDNVSSATFSGTLEGTPSYAAVFPYSLNARRNSGIYVTLPSSYEWKEGEICTPMLAQYANTLSFKHLGGLVMVTLKDVPANAFKFVFNTDYDITGEYLINYNQDTFSEEIVMNQTATNNEVTYTFTLAEARDMVFYVPVPVGEYKFGFTLYDADGNQILNKQGTTANTVSRAVLLKMPALICDGEGSTVTAEEYLQKKLDAGGTVTLDDDYTGNFTVSNTVTLDLNGHKISAAASTAAIKVESGGNLTVNGGESGEIISADYFAILNNGTLTINGGIYESTTDDVAVYNNGTATLNGGSYTGKYGAVSNYQNAKMTINGGDYKILSPGDNFYDQCVIGNYCGDITFNGAISSYNSTYSVLTIESLDGSGHLYFADGVSLPMVYVVVDKMDDSGSPTQTAEVRSYVADEAALKAAIANTDVTVIVLNQDITLTEAITVPDGKTLDLNGHTLTQPE